MSNTQRDIHLVGSIPLASSRQVFEICSHILGARAKRLPDGETGERSRWITWQRPVLAACPEFEETPEGPFRLRKGYSAPRSLESLGYAEAARQSWAVFQDLRASGQIDADQRLQVSLPTPLAVVARMIELGSQAACEPLYTAALEKELHAILSIIPAGDLAIQWDVALEFAILEGVMPIHFSPVFDGIVARLRQLITLVPPAVELGAHLCYGDTGRKHFKEPEDTALLVRVANAITSDPIRAMNWIHMPVPRDRDDEAYFRPLRNLRLPAGCRLFLGLVHDEDGLAGTRRRISAAEAFAPSDFGIATECGMGRRDPATVPDLLILHTQV